MKLNTHTAPASLAPAPIEKYLLRAFPLLPPHAVRDILKARDIKLDGERAGANAVVRAGMEVSVYLPDKYAPVPPVTSFNDGRLIACVKPHGLPVDADRDGINADTLLSRLQLIDPEAKLCHRLDAATGGLVLAATDNAVHNAALTMFHDHALTKRYCALVRGHFDSDQGTLEAWLLKDPKRSTVRVMERKVPGARNIITRYTLLSEKGGLARVLLEPVTGRTHQLRAHMAFIGHPVLMDDKYGDREFNKRHTGPLRLWCSEIIPDKKSRFNDYAGKKFFAPEPDWFKEKR